MSLNSIEEMYTYHFQESLDTLRILDRFQIHDDDGNLYCGMHNTIDQAKKSSGGALLWTGVIN